MVRLEKIPYGGWKNCLKLSGDGIELVVTLDVGPRVIRLGTPGGQNLFKEFDDQMGKTSGTEWMSFGGHRLWHAPEVFPRTYALDFEPVEHTWKDNVLKLVQKTEPETGIQKEIEISIQNKTVHLTHRLINRNPWAIELAPWGLSVMAAGGRLLVPQEDFIPSPRRPHARPSAGALALHPHERPSLHLGRPFDPDAGRLADQQQAEVRAAQRPGLGRLPSGEGPLSQGHPANSGSRLILTWVVTVNSSPCRVFSKSRALALWSNWSRMRRLNISKNGG